jgi:hypothetical protein
MSSYSLHILYSICICAFICYLVNSSSYHEMLCRWCCNIWKKTVDETDKQHITLVRATGLTMREVLNRISMIQEKELRIGLAEEVQNYFQTTADAKVLDITINNSRADQHGGNYYASCSIKSINHKNYDMHLAYYYSTSVSHTEDIPFDKLHQRMKMEWPELLV